MIITLDGPSAVGKSTLAKLVSKKLGFNFLNSGMIYRGFTYYFLQKNIMPNNKSQISETLKNMQPNISFVNGEQRVIIDEIDCTPYVSSVEVQKYVSVYSQNSEIREKIHTLQRNYATKNNIVVEGRDIGTSVFPNAEYKFFIVCDMDIRSKRRLSDLKKSNPNITLKEVIDSLEKRDLLDTTREVSPLKKPEEAIIINTSHKTIDESVLEILSAIKE